MLPIYNFFRRTPRTKSEADGVRKSRRFSTGQQQKKMPPKQRSGPSLLTIADEQKPAAERYAELKNHGLQLIIFLLNIWFEYFLKIFS